MGMLVVVIVVMVVVDDGAGGGRGDTIMVIMGMMRMMMSDNPDAFNAATPHHSSWLNTAPKVLQKSLTQNWCLVQLHSATHSPLIMTFRWRASAHSPSREDLIT